MLQSWIDFRFGGPTPRAVNAVAGENTYGKQFEIETDPIRNRIRLLISLIFSIMPDFQQETCIK